MYQNLKSKKSKQKIVVNGSWRRDYIFELNFQIFIICFNTFEQKSSYDLLIEFVYECNENNHF